MNTGRNKNTSYLVAFLLVVGLTAVSNSMRELAEIQRFTLDSSQLIAQYIAPAENPQIPQVVVAKLESCESRKAVPSVEIEWLEGVEGITEPGAQATVPAPPVEVDRVARRERVKSSGPSEIQLAKVDKFGKFEFHTTPFEFKVSADDNDDADVAIPVQLPLTMIKAKNRKHSSVFRLNTRDREMILRTLNRSINLRTAS